MRAWQIEQHAEPRDAMRLVDVSVPEPGPGEVRLRVEAAALGLPDVFMCRGSYAFDPAMPFTPGQEVVGTIDALGEGVGSGTALAVGSRVMGVTAFYRGFGGLADYALALAGSIYPAPERMAPADAACFVIPFQTAYLALVTRGHLRSGETLLVLGAAGGSGLAAVSLGRALGARVIAVARGDAKAAACLAAGADHVIDGADFDLAVREQTSGRGVDLVFDPVGGDAFDRAVGLLASEGRLLAIGYASGEWHNASTRALVGKNASVLGVFVGAYAKPFLDDVHAALMRHWNAGEISPLVSREIDFADACDGLEEIASRRAVGKVVVQID